ncbi:MAG TPA: peptidylprolyl isomerase [Caulobacteraceae bacterium]
MKRLALFAAAGATLIAGASLMVSASWAADSKAFKPKLDPPTAADWRTVDPQNLLVIDTTKGRILVEMVPEVAPQSVARIKELAHAHFYDGLTWQRVVDGFMAQGGDPKGDGSGGSDKPNVPAEFNFRRGADMPYVKISTNGGLEDGFIKSLPVRGQSSDLAVMTNDGKVSGWGLWCTGVAGMARAGDPDSANSQFFLMRDFNAGLERKYTPWGRVLVGEDVVLALKTGEPVVDPDKMTSVRLATDLPAGQQPKVQVVDTKGPWVKTAAKYALDVCDIDLPAKLVN